MKIFTNAIPCAKWILAMDIKYPSKVICLFLPNLPTKASKTLLLAVAPPAHNKPLKQYDETFDDQAFRLNDKTPTGPHLRNAV